MLKRTTPADRGHIGLPLLTPCLEARPIGDEQLLLVSETFNTLLRGRIHCDLLPLCDGRRSSAEIAAALAPTHSAAEVRAAITALASRGYLVSGDHRMAPGRAAYWSSLGASPRWAEQRLREATATVEGPPLARHLEALGISTAADHRQAIPSSGDAPPSGALDIGTTVTDHSRQSSQAAMPSTSKRSAGGVGATGHPSISVIVCADYLDEGHAAINRRHLESGRPWVLVRPSGMQPLFGPVFRPADGGPCWECIAYRLGAHQEVHNFLRNLDRAGPSDAAPAGLGPAESDAARPGALEPTVMEAVCGLAAAEIAKWLVLDELAPIHDHAVSLDAASGESRQHRAMRRPQCRACGDEALFRPDRPAQPVRLQSSPKLIRNSGGQRAVAPEATLAKYRHLVSPITGVVTWLTRITDAADPWMHVYWAGNNYALASRSLSSLRRSLRSKSAGKGSTAPQSEASALCEAVERYSGAFHGDEIRTRRRLADFERAGPAEPEAIHPNDVQLFSDRQLDEAVQINAAGHPYNFVPPRLDPEAEIDWSPVWSLTQQRHRYLPTAILYGMAGEDDGSGLKADSNGCAAGNTLEEAILQGFLELVERDAFALWWYNRLRLPAVDLSTFDDEYLAAAAAHYGRLEREMWVLDATGDFGIPVFAAVSRRAGAGTEDILYGAGAHPDPHIAALRAVCELNQCLQWVTGPVRGTLNDPTTSWWLETGSLAEHRWLAPASDRPTRRQSDYPVPDTADTREDVERCQALVEARGMELLVLDQTRPDIGMPVARVIVPGMRHFWPRFAPGRLFDAPVKMGWLDRPLAEDQMNPVPVIA